jgi:hypothetical protein
LLTGVLLEKLTTASVPLPVRPPLTVMLGLLSHLLLDKLSRLTYHPPKADVKDPFWLSYHAFLLALTIYVVARYRRHYRLGLISASLPDFEWLVVHPSRKYALPLWREPVLHQALHAVPVLLRIPVRLPQLEDRSLRKGGALVECAALALLLYINHQTDT